VAGDFYIAVQQNANEAYHYQDDIQITVAVTGQRSGAPAYRGPDPTAALSPTSPAPAGVRPPAGRPSRLVPVAAGLAGGAVLACLAVALLVLYRMRSRRS
jgi:hypothetical protein